MYCCKTPQYCRSALLGRGSLFTPQQRVPRRVPGPRIEPKIYLVIRQPDIPLSYAPAPSGTLQFDSLEAMLKDDIEEFFFIKQYIR